MCFVMKRGMKRVYIYRVNYFARTKRIYDILIMPKKSPPYLSRHYHESIRNAGIFPPHYGYCGVAFVVQGGGGANESNLDSYKNI